MDIEIHDPLFREAVYAIDHGDEEKLARLLDAHPHLLIERLPAPKEKELLNHNLNVNVNAWNIDEFHTHSTPLHQAVLSGSVESVKALIDAGADIRIKDKEHNGTPLGWAIYCHQTSVEQFLREHIAGTIVKWLVEQGIVNQHDASKAIHLIASEIVA